MFELHVLNGDCAWKLWKKCDFSAQSLVWRETYIEGPLPAGDDLNIFRSARAGYLAEFAELADTDKAQLYEHLRKMDEAILELPENATLMLWFDSCIFDQTILMRILYLLELKKCDPIDVFLWCCNGNCLTENDFQTGMSKKLRLLAQDFQLGAEAWNLFCRQDAENMLRLAGEGNFERLPAMKKALIRCAEEIPTADGLNRTRRQILQLVSDGKHSFMEIFKGLAALEEFPFLGDTACRRNLDHLVGNNWLQIRCNGYFLPEKEDL